MICPGHCSQHTDNTGANDYYSVELPQTALLLISTPSSLYNVYIFTEVLTLLLYIL
jgi:hypothetical protein